MAEFAVQARQLRKAFRSGDEQIEVLRGVELDVPVGEFVSIMGPSGSGKSTLLNLVGLLDVPTGGAIRLMGTETHRMSANQRAMMRRANLGFVFQSFNLMPRLNALHNVMLPMAIAGVPRRRRKEQARDLLESVGLGDRLQHRPSQLSGGQKQRVAIARALALDPPILLADEPTGNLDSTTSAEVMRLFQRLNEAGKTILQVTHDEEMADYSTRVLRFRDGRIVSQERRAGASLEEPSFYLSPPKPREDGAGSGGKPRASAARPTQAGAGTAAAPAKPGAKRRGGA
jgi:putative ABC transport system ATP-binding protein